MYMGELCCVDRALRQWKFYIQYLYGDRRKIYVTVEAHTPPSLREALAAVHAAAPRPCILGFTAWFTVLYLWAKRPKLTALEKAHRCTLQVHRSVTHIAQLHKTQALQTLTVSMVDGYTRLPTLNMEMLSKQNLNIYIRWLWKRGYMALLFIQPPRAVRIPPCSGWGGEAGKGRKGESSLRRSGDRQPSEKVETVHQQIRQRRTIHHVPVCQGRLSTNWNKQKL